MEGRAATPKGVVPSSQPSGKEPGTEIMYIRILVQLFCYLILVTKAIHCI